MISDKLSRKLLSLRYIRWETPIFGIFFWNSVVLHSLPIQESWDLFCSRMEVHGTRDTIDVCYSLGQAKIFKATCLTRDSNENGQEHFWKQFQKASLKTQKSPAIWSWRISFGTTNRLSILLHRGKWRGIFGLSSLPSDTITRSAPDESNWSLEWGRYLQKFWRALLHTLVLNILRQ